MYVLPCRISGRGVIGPVQVILVVVVTRSISR